MEVALLYALSSKKKKKRKEIVKKPTQNWLSMPPIESEVIFCINNVFVCSSFYSWSEKKKKKK
jgi:hypothetical protein